MKKKIVGIIFCMLLIGPVVAVTVTANQPPETPQQPFELIGNGYIYTIQTSSTDSDGDDVFYLFDWGDGTYSEWLGPIRSGDSIGEDHAWNEEGTYTVKVKAKDIHGAESSWSEPRLVQYEKRAYLVCSSLKKGERGYIGVTILNEGSTDATNLVYMIEVKLHGRFSRIFKGSVTNKVVDRLDQGETTVLDSDLIRGFGFMYVNCHVGYYNGHYIAYTGYGGIGRLFVFGSYIIPLDINN